VQINYWLWGWSIFSGTADIGLLYVHTTDYPMHTWAPGAQESKEHLAELDRLLGEAMAAAPDAAFLITADHGMNYKTRCWDLFRACRELGNEVRFALSAEKDRS
jgi:phosphonoacetate hydrolase